MPAEILSCAQLCLPKGVAVIAIIAFQCIRAQCSSASLHVQRHTFLKAFSSQTCEVCGS